MCGGMVQDALPSERQMCTAWTWVCPAAARHQWEFQAPLHTQFAQARQTPLADHLTVPAAAAVMQGCQYHSSHSFSGSLTESAAALEPVSEAVLGSAAVAAAAFPVARLDVAAVEDGQPALEVEGVPRYTTIRLHVQNTIHTSTCADRLLGVMKISGPGAHHF